MTRDDERDPERDLPELDADEERRLGELLLHAWSPRAIDTSRHERLLEAALEDPFAAPSPEELVESVRLRQALDGHGDHQDLHLARALSAAFAPRLEPPQRELARGPSAPVPRSGQVIFYRFAAVTAALAVAAAVLLRLTPTRSTSSTTALDLTPFALVQSRSTAAFFQADSAGAPSERIDRIASARSRDLRDNRYALWGVR